VSKLLLVGSVPLETPQKVFEKFGQPLARYLDALPDGEVGPRRYWVSGVHYRVFALHPDLEILRRPRRDNGVERLVPHDQTDTWQFKVKPGVKEIVFGDPGWRLGFALDAINSHALLSAMKRQGKMPERLRLQVSLPAVNSVCAPANFPVAGDLDIVRPGFTAAMQAEVATMTSRIPRQELAIQFDLARETIEASGGVPGISSEASIEASTVQIRALAPSIPEDVQLGYHFCFGTIGGWPRFAPADLGATVALANTVVGFRTARRLDPHPRAARCPGGVLCTARRPATAGSTRLSGHGAQHAQLRRAHAEGAQVPQGFRPRRLLRLRPRIAFGDGPRRRGAPRGCAGSGLAIPAARRSRARGGPSAPARRE